MEKVYSAKFASLTSAFTVQRSISVIYFNGQPLHFRYWLEWGTSNNLDLSVIMLFFVEPSNNLQSNWENAIQLNGRNKNMYIASFLISA